MTQMVRRGVVRLDDMGPVRESATFREVFAPAGVTDTLAAYVDSPVGVPRLLVLVRHGGRFYENEVERLGALYPFLCLAERGVADPANRLPLTAAQRRIVDLVRHGLTNDEIAAQLGLSPRTVRNQLSAVYERCGVSNRTELVGLLATR